jgi:hexulose-6-phosphate isomerase
MIRNTPSRRSFLQTTLAATAGLAAAGPAPSLLRAAESSPAKLSLKKAIKYSNLHPAKTVLEKFELAKSLGFLGLEIDSPSNVNKQEAVAARDKTGVLIHGTIDSTHWKIRLSDPDPAVRAQGLEDLKTAIRDAKFYGGDTALLVPGRVDPKSDETYEKVWERSAAEVRKAIPTAEENGVKIAIEVVWNNFITKPEQLVQYVDQFDSPYVGAYFDVSNMVKFGVPPADWIRALGKRMLKFDFKGYSIEKKWVPIGEGDENWPEVLKALAEVGYPAGWATAEPTTPTQTVEQLQDVSNRMDRVLGLKA